MSIAPDVRELMAAMVKLGLEEEAAKGIGRTLNAHSSNPGAWLELAASLRRQQQYQAALLTYERAERRFPFVPELPNNRGVLLREAGALEEAQEAFATAVRLRPHYEQALESHGNVLELLGRFQEAETVYRYLLQTNPRRSTAWNNLGNCARQLGRVAEAKRCYEKALKLDPDYVFALTNLAGLLDERVNRREARKLVKRALALDPEDEVARGLAQRFADNRPKEAMLPPAWDAPTSMTWEGAATSLYRHLHDDAERRRVIPGLLTRSQQLVDKSGFMAWDTQRLKKHPVADPGPQVVRLSPPTRKSPRLFISYAWAQDDPRRLEGAYETDMVVYAIAGKLFNFGYQIVFDRDPRNAAVNLTEIDVLRRLYDCNYFVPIVTSLYHEKVSPARRGNSLVSAEWDLASQLADTGFLVFAGIWLGGHALPPRLTQANSADARDGGNFSPALEKFFPVAKAGSVGVPRVQVSKRPPEPHDWPARQVGPPRRRRPVRTGRSRFRQLKP